MLKALIAFALTAASLAQTAPAVSPAEIRQAAENFDVQKLADGVYAVIRKDPPGYMVDANSLLIINDQDVIVVDAPEASPYIISALRKLTNKPVRYVINTHWHDDHITGNQFYREAYPGVEFIGQKAMRDYLPTTGAKNRKGMISQAPQFQAMLKKQMDAGKNLHGADITPVERTAFASDIRLIANYIDVVPKTQIIEPDITVTERMTIYRGDRVIDIRHLGRGHTAADLVVHLPKESIVATGDLVIAPVPLVGSDQSHVPDWTASLIALRDLHAATLVPGHGQVMHDNTYLNLMADLFFDVTKQVRESVAKGENLEQVRKDVKLESFQKKFAGDNAMLAALFSDYVAGPAVASAYADLTGKTE